VRWHKLGEVENEYTSEKLVLSDIFTPKIFTIGRNLTKFWQKISLHSFYWDTVYIEDRLTDRRPTDLSFGQYWGNLKWPYLREGSSDPLHVWFYGGVFEVGGSNGAISGFAKSKMAARKIQMAISLRWIVRFTSCLVLGWGFRGQRIEWR